MWGRIYPHAILLIFANIAFKVSCKGQGSLTFLIDDTGSMWNDIDQVRRSVNNISDVVFNEKSSQIANMVLVTFNDPDAVVRVVTQNRDTFKRTLDAVYAHNVINEDCWEPAMNGLYLALDKSNQNSYIYVFTDAPARDYRDSHYIKQLCQQKQSQIVFVLTGNCNGYHEPEAFDVYFDIAQACSGLAFHVSKNDVSPVLKTLGETIKGNKTVITTAVVPPNVYKDIPFTIDDHTEYAIVSVSGRNVYLNIKGPSASLEKIMWNDNGKVAKLSNAKPGQYVATVMGKTRTSVIIVGRTDFFFNHGFSVQIPKTLGETSLQPIADSKVHLSIAVTDDHHTVKIVSAQILDMDEKPLKELPLKKNSGDFYVTDSFVTPSQRFKVAVNGIILLTGKPIKRIAKIPITPPAPPKEKPKNTKPITKIAEGKSIEIEYNSTVKLTCNVIAFPKPTITWINSKGVPMASKSSLVQEPYKYVSYMNVPNTSIGDKYKCYASNNFGRDDTTIDVIVKEPFTVKSAPSGIRKLAYGKEGTITCDVTSRLPIEIHWFYANELTGRNIEIKTSDKYEISSSRTQLIIKKMDMDLVGRYECKVFLTNKKEEKKSFFTRVKIDGLIPPKLQGPIELKVIKGETAVLECKVVRGLPAPKITWLFGGKSGSEFIPIAASVNVLRLTNVEGRHEGKYKCVAENVLAKAEHITTLHIQELPKFTSSNAKVYQATEGNTLLRIPCAATGVPKPVITWKLGGHNITPNTKYSIEDGTLIIRDPKASDTNSYTCVANNEVGSVSSTFKIYIRQAPRVSGVASKKVRKGSPANVECNVDKGEPKPTITWEFAENSGSKFSPITGSGKVLSISKAESKHAGRYKCVARNTVGSSEHVTSVIVEFGPEINTNTTTVEGVEGDLALRIPCDVTGVPKPVITWTLNGVTIKTDAKYTIEDGALVIMKPTVKDSSSYTCEAKNSFGSASATIQTVVEKLPKIGTIHHIYLKVGETKKLDCEAYKSSSQSIKWFSDSNNDNIKETYVHVVKAAYADDGNYTCHVSDKQGYTQTHTYIVEVGTEPKLGEEISLKEWRGDVTNIMQICEYDESTKPMPTTDWTYNGKVLTDFSSAGLGHYTCNVSNPFGSVQRSFDVQTSVCLITRNLKDAQYMPLVLNDADYWRTMETTKYYTVIEQEDKIILSCPSTKESLNTFKNFPTKSKLEVYCNKETTFLLEGKMYDISYLQCSNSIEPSLIRKKEKCSTETSELIRVGYNVSGFLETYEVCFDHANNMPSYVRSRLSYSDDELNTNGASDVLNNNGYKWYTYPGFGKQTEAGFTCKDKLPSCCYSKGQLVDPMAVSDDPAKKSTFIDPLNAIPAWLPCTSSKTSWKQVNEMVRALPVTLRVTDGIVWSGGHTFQEKHGALIPRYLWKVLKVDTEQSWAIVHVNDRDPSDKDIKCKNICTSHDIWFTSRDKYTYCCSVPDFLKAFDISISGIEESMDVLLDEIEKST